MRVSKERFETRRQQPRNREKKKSGEERTFPGKLRGERLGESVYSYVYLSVGNEAREECPLLVQ